MVHGARGVMGRLSGYKDIAAFIARCTGVSCAERTARLYAARAEADRRLPVLIFAGRAVAETRELRAWIRREYHAPGRTAAR